VIPKGVRLNNYTQADMTLLSNHINSTVRASLNNKTPYKLASLLVNSKLLNVMDLKHISPEKIVLNKNLFY